MEPILFKFRQRYIFWLGTILILMMNGCLLTPTQQAEVANTLVNETKVVIGQKAVNNEMGSAPSEDSSPKPSPDYSPDQVVTIQLDALKNNNRADDGIATVFSFASPANKRLTGPLKRFKNIIRDPNYRPMLNHLSTSLDPVRISGNEAVQRVTLIDAVGNEIVYLFFLSKQRRSPCAGCWMTDAVIVESVTPGQAA